ncbi:MAG: PilZ domain-containing protein, partial [Spirochaetota bacterium]
IKPSFALKASRYAGVLVEALVKYDYFRLESGKNFDIPVENISAGGLLFKLENPKLKKYLIKNTALQMSLLFPARQIEARGVICRIQENNSEYGVQFQEINQTDMKYIDDIANRNIPL